MAIEICDGKFCLAGFAATSVKELWKSGLGSHTCRRRVE